MVNLLKALEKGIIPESLPVYKAINDGELDNKEINVFNINPIGTFLGLVIILKISVYFSSNTTKPSPFLF